MTPRRMSLTYSYDVTRKAQLHPSRTHGSAQVVKVRGEAMAAAAAQGKPHGMLSVIGVTDDDLTAICAEARARLGGDTVCQIANFLFPQVTHPWWAKTQHAHRKPHCRQAAVPPTYGELVWHHRVSKHAHQVRPRSVRR